MAIAGAHTVADARPAMGFGAVFVISRQGDHARKRAIDAALRGAGVDHAFLDATMGSELAAEQLAARYDEEAALRHRTGSRRLHPSMVGCFLSHERVWQEIIRQELPCAAILEDDAAPVPGRDLRKVEQAAAELPADWDLLYLGVRGQRLPPRWYPLKRRLFLPWARLFFPQKYRFALAEYARLYLRPFSPLLHRAGYHQGTHAYAVSRRGAAKLLAHSARISAPPDAFLGCLILEGKLQAFALREDAFATTGAESQVVSSLGR